MEAIRAQGGCGDGNVRSEWTRMHLFGLHFGRPFPVKLDIVRHRFLHQNSEGVCGGFAVLSDPIFMTIGLRIGAQSKKVKFTRNYVLPTEDLCFERSGALCVGL